MQRKVSSGSGTGSVLFQNRSLESGKGNGEKGFGIVFILIYLQAKNSFTVKDTRSFNLILSTLRQVLYILIYLYKNEL